VCSSFAPLPFLSVIFQSCIFSRPNHLTLQWRGEIISVKKFSELRLNTEDQSWFLFTFCFNLNIVTKVTKRDPMLTRMPLFTIWTGLCIPKVIARHVFIWLRLALAAKPFTKHPLTVDVQRPATDLLLLLLEASITMSSIIDRRSQLVPPSFSQLIPVWQAGRVSDTSTSNELICSLYWRIFSHSGCLLLLSH